jgi:hypothetical protein
MFSVHKHSSLSMLKKKNLKSNWWQVFVLWNFFPHWWNSKLRRSNTSIIHNDKMCQCGPYYTSQKVFLETNTLAYFARASLMKKNSFVIKLTRSVNFFSEILLICQNKLKCWSLLREIGFEGRLRALPTNFRLSLPRANTLAYSSRASVKQEKFGHKIDMRRQYSKTFSFISNDREKDAWVLFHVSPGLILVYITHVSYKCLQKIYWQTLD